MNLTTTEISKTSKQLTIAASQDEILKYKNKTLRGLSQNAKVQGFRKGTAPLSLVEKNIDENLLRSEVLQNIVNALTEQALIKEKLNPVSSPTINITKFVPFTTLEFTVQIDIIGKLSLGDYSKIKLKLETEPVTDTEIEAVIEDLRARYSSKEDVSRAAKLGDMVWIDFSGKDPKNNQAINGADGKNYPLLLGSNTFIPGFEDELIGQSIGSSKDFEIRFPKDYSAKKLADKKVKFTVTVNNIQAVKKPAVDDKFAKLIGPFKTINDLKSDIKQNFLNQKRSNSLVKLETELIKKIISLSTVELPESIINEQTKVLLNDQKSQILNRGQTFAEFLSGEGLSEQEFIDTKLKPSAIEQLKASIILNEIAMKEAVGVSQDELESKISELKSRYSDPKMQEELSNPSAKQELYRRLLSQKTVDLLVEKATKIN